MIMKQTLVAGIDSSTQACKVMIHDAQSGTLIRSGVARHKTGTEVDPEIWWRALQEALRQAGGLEDVAAVSIGGQQHGLVPLAEDGSVIRNAILWNDTRSANNALDLLDELGNGNRDEGKKNWANRVGSVLVASITVTKLRWLFENEPHNIDKVAAIALPHDYLSWRLQSDKQLSALFTDRSEASGTGYFDSVSNSYCHDLIALAAPTLRNGCILPRVLQPNEAGGTILADRREILIGPGCGDNAGAALGIDLHPGDVALSIGTSGVVSTVATHSVHDHSGIVTGFADATGNYLPLVGTLNASRVIDTFANLLNVSLEEFSRLALSAPPGAEGIVVVPYLSGERTPSLPDATGSVLGVRTDNFNAANVARAAIEGVLCSSLEGIKALRALNVEVNAISLIGGGSRLEALKRIAPSVLGVDINIPEPGEYVASGAARQAAWTLYGGDEIPQWVPRLSSTFVAEHYPFIAERYSEVCSLHATKKELGIHA